MPSYHIGRSWSGHPLEDECPCPKAPCGLVDVDRTDPACDHHPPERCKTIRQTHPVVRLPHLRSVPDLHRLRGVRRLRRRVLRSADRPRRGELIMSDFTRGGNTALARAALVLDGAGYPRDLITWLRDCAHIVDDGSIGKGKRQPGFSAPWPAPPKPGAR